MDPDTLGYDDFSEDSAGPAVMERQAIQPDEDDDDPLAVSQSPPTEGVADAWAGVEPPPPEDESVVPTPEASDDAPAPARIDPENEPEPEERGGWTVALLCTGIAIIAACLLLPLAEENHQLAWQREKLKVDLAQIKQQVSVNDEFLRRVADDPTLAERLAQRQLKSIRQGTAILDLPAGPGGAKEETSPFRLVSLPPPNPIAAYQPLGGTLSWVVRNARARLYATGAGLLLIAAGLVLGGGGKQTYDLP